MKPRVYIETTIPSFYHEIRTEPDMIARRDWTRQWWNHAFEDYDLITSVAVFDELQEGDFPNKDKIIDLIRPLTLLIVDAPIISIVDVYIQNRLMPNDPGGDALHLALASYHRCEYLLTWNCRHLANANKFRHIQQINHRLGLFIPLLVTPLELLGEKNSNER